MPRVRRKEKDISYTSTGTCIYRYSRPLNSHDSGVQRETKTHTFGFILTQLNIMQLNLMQILNLHISHYYNFRSMIYQVKL